MKKQLLIILLITGVQAALYAQQPVLPSTIPDSVLDTGIGRIFPLLSTYSQRDTRSDTVTLIGVGDIMMGSNYPDDSRLPPNFGLHLLAQVEEILRNADVTMGNLEGVLLDSGGVAKKCANPDACYVFRSPTSYVVNLVRAGFDVMSLANNHAGDFGDEGRRSSMYTLQCAGIAYAGLLSRKYTIFERNGITFGFTAFAPNTGCLSIHDYEEAVRIVSMLDSLTDIVIVSFHGGAEGKQYQHVPRKNELFYGEDRGDVYRFSHAVIDAGADVVFGHGPHVPRAVEVYKERFIAYSLGNFATYGRINISGESGYAPIIKVSANRNGEFLFAQITPAYQTYNEGLQIDTSGKVIRTIRELTEKDFPENPVRIGDDGLITYLQTR